MVRQLPVLIGHLQSMLAKLRTFNDKVLTSRHGLVKAAGFEAKIFQLRVRNLTASANSFEKYKVI
jgi:hypothetical protein